MWVRVLVLGFLANDTNDGCFCNSAQANVESFINPVADAVSATGAGIMLYLRVSHQSGVPPLSGAFSSLIASATVCGFVLY